MKKSEPSLDLAELARRALDEAALAATSGATTQTPRDELPDGWPGKDEPAQRERPPLFGTDDDDTCYVCGQTSALPFRRL